MKDRDIEQLEKYAKEEKERYLNCDQIRRWEKLKNKIAKIHANIEQFVGLPTIYFNESDWNLLLLCTESVSLYYHDLKKPHFTLWGLEIHPDFTLPKSVVEVRYKYDWE